MIKVTNNINKYVKKENSNEKLISKFDGINVKNCSKETGYIKIDHSNENEINNIL
jgi:hypothetical protein